MWVLKWQVQSRSDPARRYVVAVDEHGTFGCDCPQGKFHRARGPCKHIREVQAGSAKATKLPSQEPGRTVATPPAVAATATADVSRLRNVKEVYAELKKRAPDAAEQLAPAGPAGLLSALED